MASAYHRILGFCGVAVATRSGHEKTFDLMRKLLETTYLDADYIVSEREPAHKDVTAKRMLQNRHGIGMQSWLLRGPAVTAGGLLKEHIPFAVEIIDMPRKAMSKTGSAPSAGRPLDDIPRS